MKKFWNLNDRGMNNQIITRRSNMKRVLAAVIASGFAFAVVTGAVPWTDSGNSGEAFGVESNEAYVGTSPDLPVAGEKVESNQAYVGSSPDLPELDVKVAIRAYVGTSPDLPEPDDTGYTKLSVVGVAFNDSTSPDLPEAGETRNIDSGEYRMVGSIFANTSPDLP